MAISKLLGLDKSPTESTFDKSAQPPPTTLFDSIVYIHVGPGKPRVFGMHKALLCHHSLYFKAALTGNFKEAADAVIELDEEDPEVFSWFNDWLYTGTLYKTNFNANHLMHLYQFAEIRLIHRLQNDIIDEIIRHDESLLGTRGFWLAWEKLLTMRPFLVDYFVRNGNLSGLHALDPEFLDAVAHRSMELIRKAMTEWTQIDFGEWLLHNVDLWDLRCERYHTHKPTDPPCPQERDF